MPHIDAFKRAPVPSKRRLMLPLSGNESAKRIALLCQGIADWAFKDYSEIKDLSKIIRLAIIDAALQRFAAMSGGVESIDVWDLGQPKDEQRLFYDIGLYDHRFVVSSSPLVEEDEDLRIVRWYYVYKEGLESELPADVRFARGIESGKIGVPLESSLRYIPQYWRREYSGMSSFEIFRHLLLSYLDSAWS